PRLPEVSPMAAAAPDPALAQRLAAVQHEIADAAAAAGRTADELTLIVVTKFHPPSLVRQLLDLGVSDFGETRHQDAEAKAAEMADTSAAWHCVGQLQSKKARAVRAYASSVHSSDRDSVVDALVRAGGPPLDCFVQLNLTDDPGRGGVHDAGLEPLV